jgi:hypothetical protein
MVEGLLAYADLPRDAIRYEVGRGASVYDAVMSALVAETRKVPMKKRCTEHFLGEYGRNCVNVIDKFRRQMEPSVLVDPFHPSTPPRTMPSIGEVQEEVDKARREDKRRESTYASLPINERRVERAVNRFTEDAKDAFKTHGVKRKDAAIEDMAAASNKRARDERRPSSAAAAVPERDNTPPSRPLSPPPAAAESADYDADNDNSAPKDPYEIEAAPLPPPPSRGRGGRSESRDRR